MNQNEFNLQRQQGNVNNLPQPESQKTTEQKTLTPDFGTYLAVLNVLQRPKRHVATVPTFIPRNFADQIQFYENGATRRTYFYINGTWRYATLT